MRLKTQNRSASALILTMFIMSGMILVAMSGAYIVFLGIRAGGLQSQSGKAYYAAEAGAEHFLWRLREEGYDYTTPSSETSLFTGTLPDGSVYNVYFVAGYQPLVFQSIGDYQTSRRNVELRIGSEN